MLMNVRAVVLAGLLFSALAASGQSYPVMFVSSTWGYADLGSWPESGGETGTAAADMVCQTLATNGNLDNPGNFHAWISDSSTDAFCRVLGLVGKKAENCGQATLPDGGPWLRTDGVPFSGTMQQLTGESMVLAPALIDETGADLWDETAISVATGTWEDGTWAVDLDCEDWTDGQSGSYALMVGRRFKTVQDWASNGATTCNSRVRLLCFEVDTTPTDLPDFEQPGAQVFVTSVRRLGNLGAWPEANGKQGLEAGDEICRTLARNAGLSDPNSFVAWLSTSAVDARDRLTYPGPWKRLDGVVVAQDLAGLTDHRLFTSISVTEKGDYVTGRIWTGTNSSGLAIDDRNCSDWSLESGWGFLGQANKVDVHWTYYGASGNGCATDASRLYCFSQVTHVPGEFSDGFESGDSSAWSSTVH